MGFAAVLAALVVAADEGVYENRGFKIRFAPGKDYVIHPFEKPGKGKIWQWSDTLCEIQKADAKIDGILLYYDTALKVEKHADWREEKGWKASGKNVKRLSERVPKKPEGNWLVREYTLEIWDNDWHCLDVFVAKGKHNFELILMCPETMWEENQAEMRRLVDCLSYGDPGGAVPSVFEHAEHKIRLPVGDDFTVRREKDLVWKWEGALLELVSKDDKIGGVLRAAKWNYATAAQFLDVREKGDSDAGIASLKKVAEQKPDGRLQGDWLAREYTYEWEKRTWHMIRLGGARDGWNFELTLWALDEQWNDLKDRILKIVGGFECGAGGAGTTQTSGRETKVPVDVWKGCGKGSWVKYKYAGSGVEMEMTHVLVEHEDDKFYVQRTDTTMRENRTEGPPTRFVVDKDAGRSGDGEKPQIEEGEETIKVAKGEYKCRWVKTTLKSGWSKVWSCDDVPFRTVKMEAEFSGARSAMELLDFEKK